MEKLKLLTKIRELYANGGNIIQYLKATAGSEQNTVEDIMISYDFQAGSYIKAFSENQQYKDKYCRALASVINDTGSFDSIMEVGVGEGTTLATTLKFLANAPSDVLGFDISWSRLKFAKYLLQDLDFKNVSLFTANLFDMPLADNSVDIVYTSHSIEPNGGRELEALQELYRVANKYIILLEPAYELASTEARSRMKSHGYVTSLYSTALKLNYNVVEYNLFEHSSNPLNPTGLMAIEKRKDHGAKPRLVCPVTKTKLERYKESFLYSDESFLSYPILEGIPCLTTENAILAVHLLTDYNQYKNANNITLR